MLFGFRSIYREILERLDLLSEDSFAYYEDLTIRINTLMENKEEMSMQLEMLEAKVREQIEVTAAAVALIEGISAKLAEAGTNPEKLEELTAELDASVDLLAEAVAANTIADPELPVEDVLDDELVEDEDFEDFPVLDAPVGDIIEDEVEEEEVVVDEPAPVVEEEVVDEPAPVVEEEVVYEPAPVVEEEVVVETPKEE
jgi:hypothetical protein